MHLLIHITHTSPLQNEATLKNRKRQEKKSLAQISKSEISSRLLQNLVINCRQDESLHRERCLGSKIHKNNKELKMRFAIEILVHHQCKRSTATELGMEWKTYIFVRS